VKVRFQEFLEGNAVSMQALLGGTTGGQLELAGSQ